MKRVRWFGASWPVSMRVLAAKMKTHPFTPESLDGFVIERVRDESIEGQYIEKLSFQETVMDPFGRETVTERVSYRSIDFTLVSHFPNIELRNAHRHTRAFVSKLLELCNFSLAIEPITVDLLGWAEKFQGCLGQKAMIDSLQVSGLQLEPGVSAKMLIKGDKDVREALKHIAAKRRFVLEKIQVKVSVGGHIAVIHMSNAGTAKVADDHVEEILPVLRASLAAREPAA